jgi:hypothetical protein
VKPRLEAPEEALERLDGEALTPGEQVRLWQRLDASTAAAPRRPGGARVLVLALAATALAVALFFVVRSKRDGDGAIANACDVDPTRTELRLGKDCADREVQVGGDDWRLKAGTAVARLDDGARVVDGQVRFRVRPRSGGQFRVQVSHGEVRVIGTVFVVEQRAGRGFVAVSEGVIEFVWSDGARERVGAGQTLRWPREPKPEPPPTRASANAPSQKPAPADAGKTASGKTNAADPEDMDQTMERLLQLRSQKRYAEAAALLEKAMGSGALSPAQQERFSYELGLALEAGGKSACAHWKKHVKRFGSARHAGALTRRLERCRAE